MIVEAGGDGTTASVDRWINLATGTEGMYGWRPI